MAIRYLIAAALMASACAAHADVIPTTSALYQKVSASVGSDSKVSLKQGTDGVYVTGLTAAKAAAVAGDGMSVIVTPDGFKIVEGNNGLHTGFANGVGNPHDADATTGVGIGNGNGGGAAAVPEPSSIALMLAGMLGVAGIARRRAR
jgi:hypothetical protein